MEGIASKTSKSEMENNVWSTPNQDKEYNF